MFSNRITLESKPLLISRLAAAVLLFFAYGDNSPGYYIVFHGFVCGVCIAVVSLLMNKIGCKEFSGNWSWGFALIAFFFNPFYPFPMEDGWPLVIDVIAGVVVLLSIIMIREDTLSSGNWFTYETSSIAELVTLQMRMGEQEFEKNETGKPEISVARTQFEIVEHLRNKGCSTSRELDDYFDSIGKFSRYTDLSLELLTEKNMVSFNKGTKKWYLAKMDEKDEKAVQEYLDSHGQDHSGGPSDDRKGTE